jgi:acetyl-CoA/propionyl-CoA carboxylase biotin carboxyl carrier protein
MPAPGPVHVFKPAGGPGVRVDSGVQAGDEVSGSFDSLLAKLIVTGATRDEALQRARRALDEFEVAGLPTVLPFHRAIVRDPAFAPADGAPFSIYTRWIETEFVNEIEPWSGTLEEQAGPQKRHSVVVEVEGRRVEVTLPLRLLPGAASARTSGPAPRRRVGGHAVDTAVGDAVKAPMQATVVKVMVAEGDVVVKGDLLLVLEAMKMEQPMTAHKDGVIGTVGTTVGATVSSGHLLLTVLDAAA